MLSKMTMMMSVIAIIIIIPNDGEAAKLPLPNDNLQATPILEDICPALGSEDYLVTVLAPKVPKMGGCAFVDNTSNEDKKKSFAVYIGKLNHGKQRCRDQGMDQMRFSCQMDARLAADDSTKQNNSLEYVHLHGRMTNNEQKLNLRCALFEMAKGNNSLFRMVVSDNYSCTGLSDLLSEPHSRIPEKTILMQLKRISEIRETPKMRITRSTDDSKETIKTSFSEPRYFWMIG